MSRQKYKPKTTVLQDVNTNLAALAAETYSDKLTDEERIQVDGLCEKLRGSLADRRGGPTGLGDSGLRELALALYITVAYPGRTVDQCVYKATIG